METMFCQLLIPIFLELLPQIKTDSLQTWVVVFKSFLTCLVAASHNSSKNKKQIMQKKKQKLNK